MRDVSGKIVILLAAICVFAVGCEESGTVNEDGTIIDWVPEPGDPSKVICDPFNDESTEGDRNQGIKAQLAYLQPDQGPFTQVMDYFEFGTVLEGFDIFFNALDVPTRPFDRGFVTQSGQTLETLEGDTLYEYFALGFDGRLQLGSENAPGAYQFAVLSDDGAIFRLQDNDGSWVEWINNDGFTPTRMACATDPVDFSFGEAIPFQMDYFQGPRYHIALMLLWRPWPANPSDVEDPLCGQRGNSLFFDSTQDPPEPQPAFEQLLDRGWSVLQPSNYLLPEDDNGGAGSNPCNEPAPVISNLSASAVGTDTVTIRWTTDRPATSQVVYTNLMNSVVAEPPASSELVTNHEVVLTGLMANTFYNMQARSASISGRTTESNEITVRTRR